VTRKPDSTTEDFPQGTVGCRTPSLDDSSLLQYCQRLYKVEMHRLRIRHWNGASGEALGVSRSALVDQILRSVWQASQTESAANNYKPAGTGASFAWIALGQYGSEDLGPFSPVELLILERPAAKSEARSKLEQISKVIRSVGFEVELAVLSFKQCLQRAQSNFAFGLSLLSGRRVVGSESVAQDLIQRFKLGQLRNPLVYFHELAELLKATHQQHGDSTYLLESNLDLGSGGLLDCRALLRSINLFVGSENVDRILAAGIMTAMEWAHLEAARQHLMKARNHLHWLAGKPEGLLSHERTSSVADFFGCRDTHFRKAIELFLQRTLRHRRHVTMLLNRYLERTRAKLAGKAEPFKAPYLKLAPAAGSGREEQSPERWMKLFHFSQGPPMVMTDDLKASIRSNLPKWEIKSFNTAAMHEQFRAILKNKGKVAPALRMMRELGFLSKYLPEFGRLDCLSESDGVHKYSVDEHTLMAIDTLDQIANSSDPSLHDFQRVLDQVVDPSLIYLALLLHDTGKGRGPGHAARSERLAARALHRMNFSEESRDKMLLLVQEHLLLGHVSQRRDIDDPLIVQEVSDTVETADNLNMLLLLTYADLCSMGEHVWSERKQFLLWSLYFKVFDRLMFGDEISQPEHAQVAATQQKVLELLGREFDVDKALKHFLFLPERYALYTPLTQILSHIRLCERLQDRPVATEWVPHPHAGYTQLNLTTRDLPGRFAEIAGCLAANGLSILSAQLNTRDDGIVIDTFQVSDAKGHAIIDAEDWSRVDRLLAAVIAGERKLATVLEDGFRPPSTGQSSSSMLPRVRIDNDISNHSTVIEVQTEDRLGLGYHIAKTLADLGLNILSAKLATEKNHAFDVFYVQTHAGEKVTSGFQMTEVLERLRFRLNVA
jgi:[protein-PII] uridylyltransferase